MCLLELATLEYPYSECHGVAQIFRKVTQVGVVCALCVWLQGSCLGPLRTKIFRKVTQVGIRGTGVSRVGSAGRK